MKSPKYILYFVLISISLFACKNDTEESTKKIENEPVFEENSTTNQTSKDPLDNIVNNVVSKMMFTTESKMFVRYLISAELIDQLSIENGSFTIFAPSNKAFEALTGVQLSKLQNYREKEFLTSVLKSHIINENMDSVKLVQEIKNNRGKLTLTTLSGAELKLSMKGSDIIVTDENGTIAKIGKSDINGSNGVVHILDSVLLMN
jgi:uncharacterized surface protein with fasciclin (FAS1) repeats